MRLCSIRSGCARLPGRLWMAVYILGAGLPLHAAAQDAFSPVMTVAEPELAGQALAQHLRSAPPEENTRFTGTLKILPRGAEPRSIPLICNARLGQSTATATNWDAIYVMRPADKAPEELLIVRFQVGRSNEYFHALGTAITNAPDEASRVSGAKLEGPLAGSDFWLCDLGLEFLHWPTQRVVKAEMRRSRSCRVLDSINPHPTATGYARVRSWIDTETSEMPYILEAMAYDANNKLIKQFSLGSVKKVEGQWQLKDMKIRTARTGSRTWLEFDLKK
jgi:hypothetical protein